MTTHAEDAMLKGFKHPKRLDLHVEETEPEARAKGCVEAVLGLVDDFSSSKPEDITVTTLQGGITNQLYLLRDEGKDAAALVRLYGKNTELLIDRAVESLVFHILGEKEFGPKLHGLFKNGRVEGFIPSKSVLPDQMGQREPVDYADLIAKELATMHHLDMPLPREPYLWHFLHKFRDMTNDIAFPDNEAEQAKLDSYRLPELRERLAQLEKELPSASNNNGKDLLEEEGLSEAELAARKFLFECSFCHNDLLAGNVLYVSEPTSRMQFIDFEYGKYNFRGFDFANHFCEYAGFDFDLERWYPTPDHQRFFVKTYIDASAEGGDMELASLKERLEGDKEFAEAFYTATIAWIDRFAVSSHFFWGLWALIQKLYSPIDFDYFDYARLRLTAISLPNKE
mmetsp:Transcript_20346/g.39976  ORF Transcript_20346/g.39976 Transcript_20346/m.39976 type:complete len:397 (-) Transcript_20346:346-1536(-)|eukprot:CAMPEP_0171495702 /NCGR_PEP_ID=MMETSP0958-20121227/6286_1 /TAXON_ID=87120 /ORGANISM="Aurantiochytrium limacinum, Strain ATCCMYA-1381" /LENGTH=396 /DNA_ID=CAMNT_0012029709 /DNA_START=349 /DNA_END=1539 /DNA_ORIENTATION=-